METPTSFDFGQIDGMVAELLRLKQENERLKATSATEPKEKEKKAYKLTVLQTTKLTEDYWSGRVRFNLLKDAIEIRTKDSGQWVPHDIEAIAGLYIELGKVRDENPDKTVVIDTIRRMARANEYNPLIEYFEGLRHADADVYKFNNLANWAFGILSHLTPTRYSSRFSWPLLPGPLSLAVTTASVRCCWVSVRSVSHSWQTLLRSTWVTPLSHKPIYQIDQVLVAAKQSLILRSRDAFTKSVPHSVIKTFFSAGRSVTPIKNKNAQPFVRSWVVFGTSNLANFIPNDLRRRFPPINLFHLKQGEFQLGDAQKLFDARMAFGQRLREYFRNGWPRAEA